MGKGDKRTRRGKIVNGTYGVRRKKKKSKSANQSVNQKKKDKQ
jgi:30S ribosomal protein S31